MRRKLLKTTAIVLLIIIAGIVGLLIYIQTALPNTGPAPSIVITPTPEMISRGSYLANHVTVCVDCHSVRDWSKFSGPIVPGTEGQGGELFDKKTGFPGKIYSANITPYNINTWSDGELYKCITTGVTKDNIALFPVMPYHYYGQMDSLDVVAIIAYLRTLHPKENAIPAREINFPMNFIINTIPEKAHPLKRPEVSNTLEYGKYLTTIAGCAECHTKKENGKQVGPLFAGGWEFTLPGGNIVRSANITPDKETGMGNLTAEGFIGLFKKRDPKKEPLSNVSKADFQSIMPWSMYAGMDSTDLIAIYTYLQKQKPVYNPLIIFSTVTPNKNR